MKNENRSVRSEVIAGRRMVEIALEKNPTYSLAMVTEAALLLIQAESEPDARTRRALASQADAQLQRALEVNPLLWRGTADLQDRIEALTLEEPS
jgi:hypothetical protein